MPGATSSSSRLLTSAVLALATAGVVITGACAQRNAGATVLLTLGGEVMGTTYAVRIVADAGEQPVELEVSTAVAATLAEIDDLMTTYRDSEVTRFNAWRRTAPFPVSPPTATVVARALTLAAATGGALDVTVAPLVAAFGFGPEPPTALPGSDLLQTLRDHTSYRRLALTREGTLVKANPELEIDLSALAKGFAVDRAAAALDQRGFDNYMIEVGGELRARGFNERRQRWQIGIERPDAARGVTQRIIALADMSLATSGDYRNYREIDGHRISHIIDPRSGRPVSHRVASATVLHPECITADGLATAMMVLGEEGITLAESNGWAVLLLLRDGDDFVELSSSHFTRLVESEP